MIGIVHSGITVRDLEKSISFYRDALGLEFVKREPERKSRGDKLGVPGAVIELAIFAIPNSNASLELIQYKEPPYPNEYGAPVNALGQVHIAFHVADIKKKIEHMRKYGVHFVSQDYEEIMEGPLKGWKWIYFKDPDGANLELIEMHTT